MLVLRRMPRPVAVILLIILLAPSTSALAVSWHVAHAHHHELPAASLGHPAHRPMADHVHAHDGYDHGQAHHLQAHDESSGDHSGHDAGDHMAGLLADAADGFRSSTGELQSLRGWSRTAMVEDSGGRAGTTATSAAVVDRAAEPSGLRATGKLQI